VIAVDLVSTKSDNSPHVSVGCPESKSRKADVVSQRSPLSEAPTDSNKSPVGIAGFDEAVNGGFPARSFIILGGNAGSGKTIFSTQFLYNGAVKYNEPGVYISFAENRDDYYRSMLSLGLDMQSLEKKGLFKFMDMVTMNGKNALEVIMEQILETISEMKAKRLVIDPLSVLFQSLNPAEARTFLHTILAKVTKSLDITTIALAEIPYGEYKTGLGLEEFVADGFILMTHMRKEGSESRKLTIVKLRGTPLDRESFEYVIDKKYSGVGLVVLPRRILLSYNSEEKFSTGVVGLDKMLNGGVFKGSVTLIEGATGIGKTTFCLHFLAANAQKGMKALYISYEEPVGQIKRAMKNLGLEQLELGDNFIIDAYVPESLTPLHYYTLLSDMLDLHKPTVIALDSITAMQQLLSTQDFILFVRYLQLICKQRGLTVFLTSAYGNNDLTKTSDISVLADNIIILRYFEVKDTMGREISILKTRGSQHTKKTASFEITGKGVIV
jgi:circadian clock protein KaiC